MKLRQFSSDLAADSDTATLFVQIAFARVNRIVLLLLFNVFSVFCRDDLSVELQAFGKRGFRETVLNQKKDKQIKHCNWNLKTSHVVVSAVFLSVHVQSVVDVCVCVCVCVSICGCKVGWSVQESVSVWAKGGKAWSLRSTPYKKTVTLQWCLCVFTSFFFSL